MDKKRFSVKISIESESKEMAQKALETLGLKVYGVEKEFSQRTLKQNNALHLLFTQLADEMNAKGLDMRAIIRKEVEIQWTPYSIKEYLWRPLQKFLTGKKSTTELDKTEEINLIYENLNRILIERTKGEISLPPFPSMDSLSTDG